MKEESRPFDIAIRLPESKKYIKDKLKTIAKRNGLTMTTLLIFVIDWFLEEHKGKKIEIKLR